MSEKEGPKDDLDDIPEFLREAAKAPRKPPEPPKSVPSTAEKGPTDMRTKTQATPLYGIDGKRAKATKAERLPVPPPRLRTAVTKPTKAAPKATKPARPAPKAARKPAKAPKAAEGRVTKLSLITALLTRPSGCTGADILAATEWPSVSVPQQAAAAGLKLKIDDSSRPFRYYGKK